MRKEMTVLPELDEYLKNLDSLEFRDYPCVCQDSSIILYSWLKKCKIECKIVAGYHSDPIIGHETAHFWVETKDGIVDGTAVQFQLAEYRRNRHYKDIEDLVAKTSFCFESSNCLYQNKVDAYIPEGLQEIITGLINDTSNNFEGYMENVKQLYKEKSWEIQEYNQYMMFSSLYKIDKKYNNLSYDEFVRKCGRYSPYIIEY